MKNEEDKKDMVLVIIVLTFLFGVGLYLIIAGSVLPFVLPAFPIGITVINIILGSILVIFSMLGMLASDLSDDIWCINKRVLNKFPKITCIIMKGDFENGNQ